jgi:hypothetical protein
VLSLFIVYKGDFRDIVSAIEQFIEKPLTITKDEISEKCSFKLFDIEFMLMESHNLDDDFGIPFTNYQIQINMIQLCLGQRHDSYLEMFKSISVYLADKISTIFNTEVIIVEELQNLIYKQSKQN